MKMDHSLGSREYGLDVKMVLERNKRETKEISRKLTTLIFILLVWSLWEEKKVELAFLGVETLGDEILRTN